MGIGHIGSEMDSGMKENTGSAKKMEKDLSLTVMTV